MNEKNCLSIKIWLKFDPKHIIDNKSVLVQIIAWHRTDDKLLLEPPTSMIPYGVNKDQWVNYMYFACLWITLFFINNDGKKI